MNDPCQDLREASYEELLEVVIHHYDQRAVVVHDRTWLIRLGFALACEGGWRHVAPDWLVEYRNRKLLFHE